MKREFTLTIAARAWSIFQTLNVERSAKLVLGGITVVAAASPAWGSGFVKGPNEHYVKMQATAAAPRTHADSDLRQTVASQALYAEAGLPLSFTRAQIAAYVARKSVERTSPQGSSFTSAALTDTQLVSKWALPFLSLNKGVGGLATAVTVGGMLPTTAQDFRPDGRAARAEDEEVRSEDRDLVASVDRGEPAYVFGTGISAWASVLWANLGITRTQGSNQGWRRDDTTAAVGVGLPFHSWVQLSYGVANERDDTGPAPTRSTLRSTGGSIGLTFYQGTALEAGVTRRTGDASFGDEREYAIGVSHRSL